MAGGNANFNGKILYRYCRKPVYTPSNWDPALADRSADLPQARLVLEFIYGYQGERKGSNDGGSSSSRVAWWSKPPPQQPAGMRHLPPLP